MTRKKTMPLTCSIIWHLPCARVIVNIDDMECFFIRYNGHDAEVYADGKDRKSVFAIHLQTGPIILSVDTYADGSEHWEEEEYGATQLAAELGSLIEAKMDL